jgi:hypothetical protein
LFEGKHWSVWLPGASTGHRHAESSNDSRLDWSASCRFLGISTMTFQLLPSLYDVVKWFVVGRSHQMTDQTKNKKVSQLLPAACLLQIDNKWPRYKLVTWTQSPNLSNEISLNPQTNFCHQTLISAL